jgi:hypothetical protein
LRDNERLRNYGRLIQSGVGLDDALELQRIARRLHHLDENACNISMDDKQTESHVKQAANLVLKAQAIVNDRGFTAYHQGDPRGCSLYLVNEASFNGTDLTIDNAYDRGLSVYCW